MPRANIAKSAAKENRWSSVINDQIKLTQIDCDRYTCMNKYFVSLKINFLAINFINQPPIIYTNLIQPVAK